MTLKDFKELCAEIDLDRYTSTYEYGRCYELEDRHKNAFGVTYRTAVSEGGNCWGDEAQYHSLSENSTDIPSLDVLFEKVCPDIPFLKYKKIMEELMKSSQTDTYCDTEWYGNYTDWEIKYVEVETIYDVLAEHDVI